MRLPVNPPLLPMLAKRVDELPAGAGWIYEPKWDGFRALVFRDGDELLIQSRDEKPLDRYFPELAAPLKAELPERCVLDGEVVVARANALDFEALQLRLHPAASRAKMLSQEIPASIVFFDLLCEGDRDWRTAPFRERRAALAARDRGSRHGQRLVSTLRGRGPRRRHGQTRRGRLRIEQANDVQGQARA
jgi:ATP-dependent DNA ligase